VPGVKVSKGVNWDDAMVFSCLRLFHSIRTRNCNADHCLVRAENRTAATASDDRRVREDPPDAGHSPKPNNKTGCNRAGIAVAIIGEARHEEVVELAYVVRGSFQKPPARLVLNGENGQVKRGFRCNDDYRFVWMSASWSKSHRARAQNVVARHYPYALE
jgi:hypothetical protein